MSALQELLRLRAAATEMKGRAFAHREGAQWQLRCEDPAEPPDGDDPGGLPIAESFLVDPKRVYAQDAHNMKYLAALHNEAEALLNAVDALQALADASAQYAISEDDETAATFERAYINARAALLAVRS